MSEDEIKDNVIRAVAELETSKRLKELNEQPKTHKELQEKSRLNMFNDNLFRVKVMVDSAHIINVIFGNDDYDQIGLDTKVEFYRQKMETVKEFKL